MNKIDHRRHYVLIVDTETANTISKNDKLDMSNALAYDIGWSVVDTKGNVYRERSFVNSDIFIYETDLMESAYYADKLPLYREDIQKRKRILSDSFRIRQLMLADMREFGITEIVAHNARFDINALNNTLRWATKSKFRYWMPYGTEVWDSMMMARSVMCKMPTYRKFCEQNDYVTASGRLRVTAEILYRFISKDNAFQESHTGLEDVQIEREIMFYCYRQHKPMKKVLYQKKGLDK